MEGKKIPKTHIVSNENSETHLVAKGAGWEPHTHIINCKRIVLAQKSVGVEIDVTEAMKNIKNIVVNGVEFRRADDEQREAD